MIDTEAWLKMQWKRLLFFIIVNIFVSAVTTFLVLVIWDRSHRIEAPEMQRETPVFAIPTQTQPAPTPEPEIQLQSYQVGEGETLGEIALAFDTSIEELLALNGLTDPDSIGAGTTIFVPALDLQEENALSSEGEAPPPTNTGKVEIVGVFGAGDLATERVQIRGLGESTLSLTGWRLLDENGNEFIFPQLTLFGDGAVDIYTGAGRDTVVSLFWQLREPVWNQGETVTLADQDGSIQATFSLP